MGRLLTRFVDSELKFDRKLVNMVKQHKHLFDRTHKLFEDQATRTETWALIARELGKPVSYCEQRWLHIVKRLYDEIIWMMTYNSTSLWLLFPQLAFLGECIDWADILSDISMDIDIALALEGA